MTCPACNIDIEGYPVKTYTKETGEICCCNCKFILNYQELQEARKELIKLEAMKEELFYGIGEGYSGGRQTSKHGTFG